LAIESLVWWRSSPVLVAIANSAGKHSPSLNSGNAGAGHRSWHELASHVSLKM
jgi:hypothetical protein